MISRYQLNREESIVRKKYDQPILQDAPNRTTEIRLRLVFLAHESLGNNCMCYIDQTGEGKKKKARCVSTTLVFSALPGRQEQRYV
jgi:hypothetical protein